MSAWRKFWSERKASNDRDIPFNTPRPLTYTESVIEGYHAIVDDLRNKFKKLPEQSDAVPSSPGRSLYPTQGAAGSMTPSPYGPSHPRQRFSNGTWILSYSDSVSARYHAIADNLKRRCSTLQKQHGQPRASYLALPPGGRSECSTQATTRSTATSCTASFSPRSRGHARSYRSVAAESSSAGQQRASRSRHSNGRDRTTCTRTNSDDWRDLSAVDIRNIVNAYDSQPSLAESTMLLNDAYSQRSDDARALDIEADVREHLEMCETIEEQAVLLLQDQTIDARVFQERLDSLQETRQLLLLHVFDLIAGGDERGDSAQTRRWVSESLERLHAAQIYPTQSNREQPSTPQEIETEHQASLDRLYDIRLEQDQQAARQGLESEDEMRECAACTENKHQTDFPIECPTVRCEHLPNTCLECMKTWMRNELDAKGCDGLKCPECPQTLDYHEVKAMASKETFEAYDRLAMRKALGELDEFAWCLNARCGNGQLNEDKNHYMICESCGYRQCLTHKVAWHDGESCEQYDYRISGRQAEDDERHTREREDRKRYDEMRDEQKAAKRRAEEEKKTESMIGTVSKQCPGGCGWRIQRNEGCDHMTCKKCRHEFCWYVGKSISTSTTCADDFHVRECLSTLR